MGHSDCKRVEFHENVQAWIGEQALTPAQGSWSVVGRSGSIAIHISMSPSNELLFFERPHTTGGYVGQNPYLTVLPQFLV